ncbi:MAG: AI-2E family transporter [Francisellaceae bacterium]
MFRLIKQWYYAKFDSNEPAIFLVTSILAVLVILFLGNLLIPVLAGIVIAYLLDAVVGFISRIFKIHRLLAVYLVFMLFVAILVLLLFFLLPQIVHQAGEFLKSIPAQVNSLKQTVASLAEKYPHVVSQGQIQNTLAALSNVQFDKLATISQSLIKFSISSLTSVFTWLVDLFLVPMLAFFFLKDKETIIRWFVNMLPQDRGALAEVWADVRPQLGNYVKGKTIECVIVGFVTYLGFIVFKLDYSLLLAVLVGLSVFIPYIGMVLVTIPVILIGLTQFGFSSDFFYMFVIYLIIQALDGNVLVPILYSEALSLHPVAVIASVLIFGGLWGFWGLFFAIPLAALINSGIKVWMGRKKKPILKVESEA